MKFRNFLFPLALGVLAFSVALPVAAYANQNTSDTSSVATSLFELNGMKAKTSTSAGFNSMYNDTRKGLSLYSYASGCSATYKTVLSSSIDIDLKSSTLNQTSPNLYHYSIKFTNVDNNEYFKLHIEDNGTSNTYYVETKNGDKASFYSTNEAEFEGKGLSKLSNSSGKYLTNEFDLVADSTYITFIPSSVSVYATCNKKTIKIWDFTSDYIDGKKQIDTLSIMKNYQISFEFEEAKANAKNELTIYSIGETDFSSSFLSDTTSSIAADFTVKGLVDEKYEMPIPTNANKNDVKIRIYDEGKIISDAAFNETHFIPTEAKSYYVVYYTDTNSGWFKLDVESIVSNNFILDPTFDETSVGHMASYVVPKCKISSNLLFEETDAVVTIAKKDEEPLKDYTNVTPGFTFTFDEVPEGKSITYTFTYSYKNSNNCNFDYVKTFEKKVIKLNESVVIDEYNSLYAKNSILGIHEATVYKDGGSYSTTFETTYPSGYKTKEASINLTEAGYYTITYTYSKGSFTRKFAVVQDINSLFTTSNVSSEYAYSTSNDKYAGYMANFKNNGTIIYNKTIKVKELSKDDCLIGLMAQPKEMGTSDLTTIVITLTDANDSTNYIKIRLRQGNDDMATGTFIRAAAYNQDYAGYYFNPWSNEKEYVENSKSHEMGGFVHLHDFSLSFSGYNNMDRNTVRLYFDNETKTIYSEWYNIANTLYGGEHPTKQVSKTKVAEFNSKDCFAKTWNGFTSDEVILSVSANGINGSSADVLITDIYGSSLSSEMIKDIEGPKIDVDKEGNNYYPTGVVGQRFNFLNMSASDEGSGVKDIIYKAYDPSGNEVNVSIDEETERRYFVPTTSGVHKIQYIVKDNFDNLSKESININVVNSSEFEPLDISISPSKTSYYLGESVTFPTPIVSGGAGYTKVNKEVRYGSLTGEIIESENTGFAIEKSGNYYVIYTASDYLGNVKEVNYMITSTRKLTPLFDESSISMPLSFINDTTYKFPTYQAIYYPNDDVSSKLVITGEIIVTDGSGTNVIDADGLYNPTYSESCPTASVKVVFSYDTNKVDTYGPYYVNIVSANSGSKFLKNYFISNNTTISVYPLFSQLVIDNPSLDKADTTFIRPVNENIYSLELSSAYDEDPDNPSNNFKGMKITLKDAQKANISVDINIKIDEDGQLNANVNNGTYTRIDGSLYSTVASSSNVKFTYDPITCGIYDGLGGLVDRITTTSSGDEFNGFTSEEIYTSIEFIDFSGNSAIKIISIGNQRINNTKQDTTAPSLFVGDNYYGTFELGQEITLPSATAYDVLSYCYDPTVTITYEDGSYAKDVNGEILNEAIATKERTFIPDKYGVYEVTYSAEDEAGNNVSVTKNIVIKDSSAPTFALNFEISSSIDSGTTLNLLNYTVKDNLDTADQINVEIYLILPNNVTTALRYKSSDGTIVNSSDLKDGKYTFTNKGHYRLLYLVSDSYGNSGIYSYYFTVK